MCLLPELSPVPAELERNGGGRSCIRISVSIFAKFRWLFIYFPEIKYVGFLLKVLCTPGNSYFGQSALQSM